MSRVESDERPLPKRESEERQRDRLDRTPGKAEGDEETVDAALTREDEEK